MMTMLPYLVLLQYLPKSHNLSVHKTAQCIDVVTAFVDLLSVLGKPPLPLDGQTAVVGTL